MCLSFGKCAFWECKLENAIKWKLEEGNNSVIYISKYFSLVLTVHTKSTINSCTNLIGLEIR